MRDQDPRRMGRISGPIKRKLDAIILYLSSRSSSRIVDISLEKCCFVHPLSRSIFQVKTDKDMEHYTKTYVGLTYTQICRQQMRKLQLSLTEDWPLYT
jgi:hypothetical protein